MTLKRRLPLNIYDLRGSPTNLYLPKPNTENLKRSLCFEGAKLWNSLPDLLKYKETLKHSNDSLNFWSSVIKNLNLYF
jgi:hypothetical protein